MEDYTEYLLDEVLEKVKDTFKYPQSFFVNLTYIPNMYCYYINKKRQVVFEKLIGVATCADGTIRIPAIDPDDSETFEYFNMEYILKGFKKDDDDLKLRFLCIAIGGDVIWKNRFIDIERYTYKDLISWAVSFDEYEKMNSIQTNDRGEILQ